MAASARFRVVEGSLSSVKAIITVPIPWILLQVSSEPVLRLVSAYEESPPGGGDLEQKILIQNTREWYIVIAGS